MRLFKKRIDWSDFILEILSIIIGITVAFSVENWKHNNEDRELELNWMRELVEDLNDSKEKLEFLIEIDSIKLSGLDTFKYKIYERDSEYVHISSGFELRWSWLDVFSASSTTFEVIKSSGNTRVFQDQGILLDLYRIYDNFDHLEMVTNYEKEQIGKWVDPILYVHFDTEKLMDASRKFKVNRKEISEIPMLRNQVFLFHHAYSNQIYLSREAIGKIEQLVEKITMQIAEQNN